MINKLEISGADTDLQKYITRKMGKLDHYFPRHARASAHMEVKLTESKAKDKKSCTCEVILYLPHEVINTKESTLNMFAAVDIVEAKLKNQIKKYKETHSSLKIHRRLLAHLRRS